MPTYLATDGRAAMRTFSTEADALIFWSYNDCRGSLHELQDSTGIMLDHVVAGAVTWESGRSLNTGDHSQTYTINRFLNRTPMPIVHAPHQHMHRDQYVQPVPVTVNNTSTAQATHIVNTTVPTTTSVSHHESDTVTALHTEIERLKAFVDISQDDLNTKQHELEERWEEEIKKRNLVEQEKQRLLREEQREVEAENVFVAGKTTYRMLKNEITRGVTKPEQIPPQFSKRFLIYKELDEKALLDLPGDWEHFQEATDRIKEEQFRADRERYFKIRDQIDAEEMKESDIDSEFQKIFLAFRVLDEAGDVNQVYTYDMFIELVADYMNFWNDTKYGFDNDANYLEDVNIDPRQRSTAVEETSDDSDDEGNILNQQQAQDKYGIRTGAAAAAELETLGGSFLDM
jgi:hypothetical protein